MKAEFRRPYSKNRKPLQELLPLDTLLTMYIAPTNICNFACKFCFNGDESSLKMNKTMMGMSRDGYALDVYGIAEINGFIDDFSTIDLFAGNPVFNSDALSKDSLILVCSTVRTVTAVNNFINWNPKISKFEGVKKMIQWINKLSEKQL